MCNDSCERPMFADARVGDKVWDMRYGEDKVVNIVHNNSYPIKTKQGSFTINGLAYTNHKYPTLFWSRPEFTPPPRPKRKVMVKKREIKCANRYESGFGSGHTTRDSAVRSADPGSLGVATITTEWEEEEYQ